MRPDQTLGLDFLGAKYAVFKLQFLSVWDEDTWGPALGIGYSCLQEAKSCI